MTSTSFTLLLGGSLAVTDRLRALTEGSRVIAADSGMRHAVDIGVTPELWVGDFDSSDAALIARIIRAEALAVGQGPEPQAVALPRVQ